MKKEVKELFKELNKGISEMKNTTGTIPEPMKKYQRAINMTYKRHDVNFGRKGKFKVSDMSPELEQDLFNIAVAMTNDKQVLFLEDYQKMYERGDFARFNPSGIKDVVQLHEQVKSFKQDSALNSLMTYDQYVDIKMKAEQLNYKGNLEQDMWLEYSMTGATGDILFQKITQEIEENGKVAKLKGQIKPSAKKRKKRQF